MPRREARGRAEAAGAGQPAPAWPGGCGCGAEPAAPPPGCAAMGGQVTRSLLYGKDRPLRGGGRCGVGVRALPGASSPSIPPPARGGGGGRRWARLAALPGWGPRRPGRRRGRRASNRAGGALPAGERRRRWSPRGSPAGARGRRRILPFHQQLLLNLNWGLFRFKWIRFGRKVGLHRVVLDGAAAAERSVLAVRAGSAKLGGSWKGTGISHASHH